MPLSHFRGSRRRLGDSHLLHITQPTASAAPQVVVREALGWTADDRAADYAASASWICAVAAHKHVGELALARGNNANELVMRGELLVRYASLDAEPASMIAGASSRGWITAHERPRRSRMITTESLGVTARPCAGPTV